MAPVGLEAYNSDENADRYGGSCSFVQEMQKVAQMTPASSTSALGSGAGLSCDPHEFPAPSNSTGWDGHTQVVPERAGSGRLPATFLLDSRASWLRLRRAGLFTGGV